MILGRVHFICIQMYVCFLPVGMGWSCKNRICKKEQNSECSLQVSIYFSLMTICSMYLKANPFSCNFFFSRSAAVEQLLEKNYRIHCSMRNIVSKQLLPLLSKISFMFSVVQFKYFWHSWCQTFDCRPF